MRIRSLIADASQGGDVFNERMKDLVSAMGYDPIRVNLHKPGRELDILAKHRLEDRFALVECKAQIAKIGGGDVNKFVGVLQAELGTRPNMVGYFLSTSGFRESAIEQEDALPRPRCILLGPAQVRDELVAGRVLCDPMEAAASAGRFVSQGSILRDPDLLFSESGWHWLFYVEKDRKVTGFTLVHADGGYPEIDLAERVRLLVPEVKHIDYVAAQGWRSTQSDRDAYLQAILHEHSSVTYEGLPADGDNHVPTKLRDLYVPTKLQLKTEESMAPLAIDATGESVLEQKTFTSGEAVSEFRHVAVLGGPGSGKSTLLRRVAVAYAQADSGFLESQGFKNRDLLPVLVQCRDLASSKWSVLEAIQASLPRLGFITPASIVQLIENYLRQGQALMLIDGLDEISGAGERTSFARAIKTFLAVYPQTRLMVTSREIGFRPVAGALAQQCTSLRVCDLSREDIVTLVQNWHALHPVLGKSQNHAQQLIDKIMSTDRLYRLAANPLLLVTLLLVERWIGDLPKKRSVLYEKAIEVLLMTWNVEGHEPLDLDEVLPQLGFLAFRMSCAGDQRITRTELISTLHQARIAMPDVLAYAKTSPAELVDRIEHRSSLLSNVGVIEEDGQTHIVYEFKHLTFQEYLTGLACARNWLPEPSDGDQDLDRLLRPYFTDSSWSEIIPLTSVLAGRRGSSIIEAICQRISELEAALQDEVPTVELSKTNVPIPVVPKAWQDAETARNILLDCLYDEVLMSPALVRRTLDIVIDLAEYSEPMPPLVLVGGRYEGELTSLAAERCVEDIPSSLTWARLAGAIVVNKSLRGTGDDLPALLRSMLDGSPADQASAGGALMHVGYASSGSAPDEYIAWMSEDFSNRLAALTIEASRERLLEIYFDDDINLMVRGAVAWALCWCLRNETDDPTRERLIANFLQFESFNISGIEHYAAWLVVNNCLVKRGRLSVPPLSSSLLEAWKVALRESDEVQGFPIMARLVILYQSNAASDEEIIEWAKLIKFQPRIQDALISLINEHAVSS